METENRYDINTEGGVKNLETDFKKWVDAFREYLKTTSPLFETRDLMGTCNKEHQKYLDDIIKDVEPRKEKLDDELTLIKKLALYRFAKNFADIDNLETDEEGFLPPEMHVSKGNNCTLTYYDDFQITKQRKRAEALYKIYDEIWQQSIVHHNNSYFYFKNLFQEYHEVMCDDTQIKYNFGDYMVISESAAKKLCETNDVEIGMKVVGRYGNKSVITNVEPKPIGTAPSIPISKTYAEHIASLYFPEHYTMWDDSIIIEDGVVKEPDEVFITRPVMSPDVCPYDLISAKTFSPMLITVKNPYKMEPVFHNAEMSMLKKLSMFYKNILSYERSNNILEKDFSMWKYDISVIPLTNWIHDKMKFDCIKKEGKK